ncbi:MAG TPA: glycosyltransferase [Polyangia bacterium]|nr:glycosyltransferase [Polyangia bacterium]
MTRVGVVAIGRNEGERLRRCLASLVGRVARVVYVDSGSTDDSVALARAQGADVVCLDQNLSFTAARARNAGIARLRQVAPDLDLIQLVDGDCEIVAGWLEVAQSTLRRDPKLAVVCGRRRERHPEASVYNRLCDLEWNTPIGSADSCGGDAMMRAEALREVNGYQDDLIAGEEPDLCLRLRQRGWKILRVDAEMTLHDADMMRFDQWWQRSVRAGFAFAEGAARHGHEPERHWVRAARSNWFWGVGAPTAAVGMALPTLGMSLGLVGGGYFLLGRRILRTMRQRGFSRDDAALYARYTVLSKLPQGWGQIRYWALRLGGRRAGLIEYKRVGS